MHGTQEKIHRYMRDTDTRRHTKCCSRISKRSVVLPRARLPEATEADAMAALKTPRGAAMGFESMLPLLTPEPRDGRHGKASTEFKSTVFIHLL